MVIIQKPAESFAALDLAVIAADIGPWLDQAVAQTLVIPFVVIVFEELGNSMARDASLKRINRSRHSSLMLR